MQASSQLHAPATLPPKQRPQYPLNRTLGGPQSRSGCSGEDTSPRPLLGISPPFLCCPSPISVSILTAMWRVALRFYRVLYYFVVCLHTMTYVTMQLIKASFLLTDFSFVLLVTKTLFDNSDHSCSKYITRSRHPSARASEALPTQCRFIQWANWAACQTPLF
jgi:hypothetical protein